jgi:hypothetical protein
MGGSREPSIFVWHNLEDQPQSCNWHFSDVPSLFDDVRS